MGHAAFSAVLFLLRRGRGIVRGGRQLFIWRSEHRHHRFIGSHLWNSAGFGGAMARPADAVLFPDPHQDEIFRDDHRGHRVPEFFQPREPRKRGRPSGRHAVRLYFPEVTEVPRIRSAGRGPGLLPRMETGARPEKIPGIHAQEGPGSRPWSELARPPKGTPRRPAAFRHFLRHTLGMKALRVRVAVFSCALGLAISLASQQGPKSDSSTTVARPRKPSANGTPPAAEPDQPKIPSKFGKKEGAPPEGPTFRSDAVTVTVDTAVVDNKGHFIPNIPKNYFRILEDGVPQQVSGFSVGEAPMTIAMVIEFSAAFQQFYSWGWFQTLSSAYGFLETMKPEDY